MPDQSGESISKDGRKLDRRALFQVILAIAAASTSPTLQAQANEFDLPEFRSLMVAMTGFAPRDPTLVQSFFDAFSGELAELRMLADIVRASPPDEWEAAISTAKLDGLAQTLITAFYTGMVGEGSEAKVITYLNAFVWYACGYTKPPSQCDWNFGAWAYPPPLGRFEQ